MMNKKILGMPLVALVVAVLVVGLGAAALLTYYVNITGDTTVDQSVVFSDGSNNKEYSFAGNIYAGGTYSEMFTLWNRASVPAEVEFETLCEPTHTDDCDGITWNYTPLPYEFSESILITDSYYLDVTVEEDGDWIVWTFDFPVEEWTGDGNINLALVVEKDGEFFQIHNNDGTVPVPEHGTWVYDPYIGGQWHTDIEEVENLLWVEATGDRKASGTPGILEVRILKSELGEDFHWAGWPTVGSGWVGLSSKFLPTPEEFMWQTDTGFFHSASSLDDLSGPFTLQPGQQLSFMADFSFHIALQPDTFDIETRVVPATEE